MSDYMSDFDVRVYVHVNHVHLFLLIGKRWKFLFHYFWGQGIKKCNFWNDKNWRNRSNL